MKAVPLGSQNTVEFTASLLFSQHNPGITIVRVANGKIVEQWQEVDLLGLMQQLGVIPSMGEPGGS